MKKLLLTVGFIWALPVTLPIFLFYVLPVWLLGWISYAGMSDWLIFLFTVNDEKVKNWYTRLWRDWGGFGLGSIIILKNDPDNDTRYSRTLIHESRHSYQVFVFGIFQPILYFLFEVVLWISAKSGISPDVHPYYDNPFERDARRAAGQRVDIPRSEWKRGPNDHWPWW